ncbi:MAG: hypothetical protein AAF355_02760 [Myxococcota bacterium]
MDATAEKAVGSILNFISRKGVDVRIVLLGWSRGAVSCFTIAQMLERRFMDCPQNARPEVHIFAVDPVPGWPRSTRVSVPPIVRTCVAIFARDERRCTYVPLSLQARDPGVTKLVPLIVPGSHSDVAYLRGDVAFWRDGKRWSSPDGENPAFELVQWMLLRFLRKHEVPLNESAPRPNSRFAQVSKARALYERCRELDREFSAGGLNGNCGLQTSEFCLGCGLCCCYPSRRNLRQGGCSSGSFFNPHDQVIALPVPPSPGRVSPSQPGTRRGHPTRCTLNSPPPSETTQPPLGKPSVDALFATGLIDPPVGSNYARTHC